MKEQFDIGSFVSQYEKKLSGIFIFNQTRLAQFEFAYENLVKMFMKSQNQPKIVCQMSQQRPTVGVIRVEGVAVTFGTWLYRTAEFADAIEIYPCENGNVGISITFYGVKQKIGEIESCH